MNTAKQLRYIQEQFYTTRVIKEMIEWTWHIRILTEEVLFDPGEIWVSDGVNNPGLLTCSGSSLLVRMPHGSDSSGVQLNCQSWWTWRRTFCTRKSAACGLCVGRPSCGAYIHRRTWMWHYKSGTGNSVYLRASADASLGSRPVWTFSHSGHTGKA